MISRTFCFLWIIIIVFFLRTSKSYPNEIFSDKIWNSRAVSFFLLFNLMFFILRSFIISVDHNIQFFDTSEEIYSRDGIHISKMLESSVFSFSMFFFRCILFYLFVLDFFFYNYQSSQSDKSFCKVWCRRLAFVFSFMLLSVFSCFVINPALFIHLCFITSFDHNFHILA